MFSGGSPAGFCDKPAFGHQLPWQVLRHERGMTNPPYCHGHCCPAHGGPGEGDTIFFVDGHGEDGRPMWCAVMPGFVDLQESEAGFSTNPHEAKAALMRAMLKAREPSNG